jgi:hypothetical protein
LVISVGALNVRQRRLAGLARAVRAAVVVPSLFGLALLVIKQPEVAGFAVFGTFAHLVMVEYDPVGRGRFAESATLTLLGAVMVSLGTLAPGNGWLAAGGAMAVGFLIGLTPRSCGRIAFTRTVLLLSFMLAVAVPAPASSVIPNLAGWLLAGIVAQPALLALWVPLRAARAAGEGESSHEGSASPVGLPGHLTWVGHAAGTGMAMGLAVLLTGFLKVDHPFWVVLGVLPVLNAGGILATRTFRQEQAGTLIGCLVGAALVAMIGAHQGWYWLILPFIVFASTYAASAVGCVAGQAAFTVFAVVLFGILLPQQRHVGILRVEDIAIGGAVSLGIWSLRRGAAESWSRLAGQWMRELSSDLEARRRRPVPPDQGRRVWTDPEVHRGGESGCARAQGQGSLGPGVPLPARHGAGSLLP